VHKCGTETLSVVARRMRHLERGKEKSWIRRDRRKMSTLKRKNWREGILTLWVCGLLVQFGKGKQEVRNIKRKRHNKDEPGIEIWKKNWKLQKEKEGGISRRK